MPLLGGFFVKCVFVSVQGLKEFDGKTECLHFAPVTLS